MIQRNRAIAMWIGAATLVVLLAGGIYAYFTFSQITDEYRSRAEFLSWAFQDQVSFDLDRGQDHDLNTFVGQLAVGNVFYAQIITPDGLTEKNLLNVQVPDATPPSEILEIEHLRLDGHSIWDLKRKLAYSDGYVRLGINLEPIESTIRMQLLILIGFGLAIIAVTGLAASLLIPREGQKRAAEPVPSMSISNGDSQAQGSGFVTHNHEIPGPAAAELIPEAEPELARTPASSPTSNSALHVGELRIDNASKQVELRGEPLELSPKEFDLLYLLAQEPGKVFSNQEILDQVWADSHMATAQDVKQYIYFVRQKVEENPKKPSLIVTVRGFGYKLQD